jgi:outer membrane murein-binding lipoprotein Lpp
MLASSFWSFTGGGRGVRWTLFVLLALCLSAGCTDPTSTNRSLTELQNKLDQLETQVSALIDAQDNDAKHFANFYKLSDSDRDLTTVAYVYSTRSIQTGEYIFTGDDVWRVEMVKIATEEKPRKKTNLVPTSFIPLLISNLL